MILCAFSNWLAIENYDKIKINLVNHGDSGLVDKRMGVSYRSPRLKFSYGLCIKNKISSNSIEMYLQSKFRQLNTYFAYI